MVARGLSNQDIADALVISPHTAKTHVNRIMTKVHATIALNSSSSPTSRVCSPRASERRAPSRCETDRMTATLVAHGLAGGHGHRTLFDGLDLTVAPGDVLGVVGANGAGKSTLLRILAGIDEPQAGTVALAPPDAFVGWLPQEHERVAGETVAQYIARRTGCAEATRDMDAAAAALGDPSLFSPGVDPADAYSAALDRWLASGAADLDERVPVVLGELGLDSAPIRMPCS